MGRITRKEFGIALKEFRIKANKSIAIAASEIGVTERELAKWETAHSWPHRKYLGNIAICYGCDFTELFEMRGLVTSNTFGSPAMYTNEQQRIAERKQRTATLRTENERLRAFVKRVAEVGRTSYYDIKFATELKQLGNAADDLLASLAGKTEGERDGG